MFHFFNTVTNIHGDSLPGYYGQVTDGSGNVIPIYSDDAGTAIATVSGIANMAKTDTDGMLSFYVPQGTYTLTIFSTDAATRYKTIANVSMGASTVTVSSGAAASSRAAMAAIANPAPNQAATLTESGREGAFVFNSSNLSAQVTADTAQGIYVAPSSDTTGASGAWVRKFTGPADPSWFGAALDGTTDDTTPLSKALALAGYVHVPEGKTLKMAAGQVVLPSSAFLHVAGEIAFNPTASQYAFVLRDNVSNVTIFGPGKITSSTDLGFLTFIRLEQAAGTTLDGLTVEGIKFEYNATPGNSSDRWALAGTGDGTRKNFRIRNNTIKGSMQLCATLVATGTFRDSEIVGNRITDARSNAISLLSSGMRGSPCTLDNVKVTDNVIITTQATNSTSLGVAVGIDSTGSPDVNVNIKNLTIARNRFDLSASSTKTADIYIRLGNKCAAIG